MMKRLNSNTSLTQAPRVKKGRSRFDLSHTNHMDFGVGLLYPITRPIDVIPGDTFDISQRSVIRISQPLKVSPMDTLVCDVNYFYVPYRLVWDNWNKFITGDSGTNWNTEVYKQVPFVSLNIQGTSNSTIDVGSLADYIGIPPYIASGGSSLTFNVPAFNFRSYYKIWNWYYRYEPLMQEALVATGDSSVTLDKTKDYTYGVQSNKLCPVVRLADYFTRCLPAPQKGPDVALDLSLPSSFILSNLAPYGSGFGLVGTSVSQAGSIDVSYAGTSYNGYNQYYDFNVEDHTEEEGFIGFTNLFGGSINGLREAFAIQKIREIDGLYGQRIDGYTEGHFGVTPPTLAFKPEYLGGHRFEINMNQVVQTSDASGATSTELGEIGGYSFTKHEGHYVTKSFTEFGVIMPLLCVRVKHHSYAQGLDRIYRKSTRFDYWLPEFANLPDQPVSKREIFLTSADLVTGVEPPVFGYQERGAELKFLPSRVAGLMRPQVSGTLAVWTYTDNYASQPSLSASWIVEPTDIIDRSLYIASTVANPFIGHFYFDIKAYRELPYHSIPGGLTHQF